MKEKSITLTVCLIGILVGIIPYFVEAKELSVLTIGGKFGWKDFINLSGVDFQKSKSGFLEMTLAAGHYQVNDQTDLLLHFDHGLLIDNTRRYLAVAPKGILTRDFSFMGDGSAVFRGQTPIVLQASSRQALFYPGQVWQDFTYEFWLYPAQAQDGEIVFSWQGIRNFSDRLEDQLVQAAFVESKLIWTFQNLFAPEPSKKAVTVELQGRTVLLPRQWHHHLIRFQAETGLLEYLMDGKTEALTYVTSSKQENGRAYSAAIGKKTSGRFLLGSRYIGAMDELRLSQSFIEKPCLEKYFPSSELDLKQQMASKGMAVTRIFDLKYPGTQLKTIAARFDQEGKSQLQFYYRMSDSIRYQWAKSGETQRSLALKKSHEETSWIPFTPGQPITNQVLLKQNSSGRYLQLRVDFLPSGTGNESARLDQIEVHYLPNLPPPSPVGVKVHNSDSQLTLCWKPVVHGRVDGYLVLWGTRPNQYTEVLDVGNVTSVTLDSLVNDQLYYLCVSSYQNLSSSEKDSQEIKNSSFYSREVSARPKRFFP